MIVTHNNQICAVALPTELLVRGRGAVHGLESNPCAWKPVYHCAAFGSARSKS